MIIGSHRAVVAADPDDVFTAVATLAGSPSATVVAFDRRWRIFSYESPRGSDDPWRARWTWAVRHAPGTTSGSIVIVGWRVEASAFLSRLLSPLRAWRLRARDVPRSVEALAAVAAGRAAARPASHRGLDLEAG